jgi:hypothetical protein
LDSKLFVIDQQDPHPAVVQSVSKISVIGRKLKAHLSQYILRLQPIYNRWLSIEMAGGLYREWYPFNSCAKLMGACKMLAD